MPQKFYWSKQPIEKETYQVDFSGYMDSAETVASKSVTITDGTMDVSGTICSTSEIVGSKSIKMTLTGGTQDKHYRIAVVGTASTGNVYAQIGDLEVYEL